jgi:NADPH:quinone reductase-like Zn-dependent oxidoreductase
MQAIVQPHYGGPERLESREVQKPALEPDGALVRVHASSVNAADVDYLGGMALVRMAAPFRPGHRIPGSDIAGVVESVGSDVSALQPGDEVFADLSALGFGAFAEYVSVPATELWPKPPSLSFEEAAAVPSAACVAIQGIRDHRTIGPDSEVLINGAGGGMGTFALQIAAAQGAHVTGVDTDTKFELIRSLGAEHVIDYREQDYTTLARRYDLILDLVARRSPRDSRKALKPDGAYAVVGASTARIAQIALLGAMLSRTGEQWLGLHMGYPNRQQDITEVTDLLESGHIHPVIDSVYPLAEAAEAMRAVAAGEVKGKAVISILRTGQPPTPLGDRGQ